MKRITIIIVGIFLVLTQATFAQFDYGFTLSKSGSAGLQFLKIGIGSRECAMGQAAGSLVDDVNALFWNPGGLGFVSGMQATVHHVNWIAGSRVDAAGLVIPIKSFTLGLSAINFGIDEFEETTAMFPNGTGTMVRAGDMMVGIALARRFSDKLSLGGQVKWVQEVLDDRSLNNVLFDIGTTYWTGFHHLRLGFVLQHFGPDMRLADQQFRTPLLFRVSAADDLLSSKLQRLTMVAELVHPTDANELINLGLEYELLKILALRCGYRTNVDEGDLTFGVGIVTPQIIGVGVRFDYAMSSYGSIFGDVHQFSIGIEL